MNQFELSTLELEYGNFDLALEYIKTHADAGDSSSIQLLAEINLYGIGTQKNESEYTRLIDSLNSSKSDDAKEIK